MCADGNEGRGGRMLLEFAGREAAASREIQISRTELEPGNAMEMKASSSQQEFNLNHSSVTPTEPSLLKWGRLEYLT